MTEQQRLLVIGIDGATYDLLDPMIERGLMPSVAALMRQGFCANLRSTVPPNSAAAWTTFMTGRNPGQHGILRFQATRPTDSVGSEFQPGAYTFLNSASIGERRLWDILSAAGKRVAVINVPLTYPPQPLNGIMITGLLTPPGATDFTYPPELVESLGNYQIEQPLAKMGFGKAADRELVLASIEILRQQGETALRFLRNERWDFFFVCFTQTDRIQHRLWHYLEMAKAKGKGQKAEGEKRQDEGGRMRDEEKTCRAGLGGEIADAEFVCPRLESYYRLLDETIGRLVEAAGHEANCIILSDHGFGPAPQWAVYKRPLARQMGLAAGEGAGGFHSLRSWLERRGILDGDRLRRLLSGTPLRWLLSRISRLVARKEQDAWRASRAYLVVLHKYIGGIGINLSPSDSEYEPLRQSLMTRLQELSDPQTGQPLVTAVWRREELYRGRRLHLCPDIIFRLDYRYGLAHGESPGGRLVSPKRFRSSGIHRDEGILLMSGSDVVNTRSDEFFQIADVSATALYLLGIPIPSDFDGQIVAQAIVPAHRERCPVRTEQVAEQTESPPLAAARWRSDEDEDAIAEQLRQWGYLE